MLPTRAQVWAERLDRYRASSLTVKAFCQAENVSVPSFYQWKKRLAQTQAAPAFVPVNLTSPASDELDLLLPGGATLKLNVQLDEAAIRKVLAATIVATCEATAS